MANTSLLLTNPDFDSLRASLRNFLRSQTQFRDYDFDGSNMAVLIDLLAFNSYNNAFTTNMVASEMFMDSATLRASVVSHAKELGYVPRSWQSPVAYLDVEIVPDDDPGVITMPRGTQFLTAVGTQTFNYLTDEALAATPDANGQYIFSDVAVYEGIELKDVDTVDTTIDNQMFTISNARIDTRSIRVSVIEDSVTTAYTLATTLHGLDETSKVFFLQLGYAGFYEVYFGDDNIGYRPAHGSGVTITYRVTKGDISTGANMFRPTSTIAGYSNVITTSVSTSTGGGAPESIASIKRSAPQIYQTRRRAVTADDYKVLLQQEFPEIQAVAVYGGELVDPPQYGSVLISVDLEGIDGAPDANKAAYYRFIRDRAPLTIEPVFIDPQFLYVSLTVTVNFDYTLTSASARDIEATVLEAITDYNTDELSTFEAVLRASKLIAAIDDSDDAILSNETDFRLVKYANTTVLDTASQTLQFYNEFAESTSILPTVTSSSMRVANQLCSIVDNTEGVLHLVNAANTVLQSCGTVDYTSGSVTITPIAQQAVYGSGLRIYVRTAAADVTGMLNTILEIDLGEVSITATPQRT